MVRRARILLELLLVVLFTSCHKEICMDHHHDGMKLAVTFDWSGQDTTSVKSMQLLFYPEDISSPPLRYSFSDIKGDTISVTSGNYKILCVNEEENLQLLNADNWETVSISTGQASLISRTTFNNTRADVPRATGAETEIVLREPPKLFTDICPTFYVRATEEIQTLTLSPKMQLGKIHVKVENVDNANFLRAVSGAITGLSSALNLTTLQPSEVPCTMPISLRLNEDGDLEGDLYIFGHCSTEKLNHILTIYTMLIDTSKQANEYDITEQMHSREEDPGKGTKDVQVLIPTLPLPTPEPAKGGFDLSLDDWATQTIDIQM
ncbi:MAG: DUF5119 domain-containing protein [Bacteroidales bacterium]|nr:DUF5119 domain-containing protein [Bacteroidales bacterium]